MGNILRRSSAVHPASGEGMRGGYVADAVAGEKKGRLRIKVRMRRDKFEELLYLASRGGCDQSDGGNKIGFLILKECMEGRLPASVLGSDDDVWSQRCGNFLVSRRLG
ncbi:hypothetical protein EUTSA_v10006380mg [Eutrema salsugineum]|uniref:Uncharacterized protein n=1 Tax=Eutrema salsugineum TaxID=72664 RepID=V4ND01_EUTSA|nr:uncharacterized protein LOC18020305 [Eutrema salsugineum]ESQ43881.1 hypothetical protein EUTSA_v10006380mg [Eutrema salsugineum]